jgi:hypothetical protein
LSPDICSQMLFTDVAALNHHAIHMHPESGNIETKV